jgi:hypothetical protein
MWGRAARLSDTRIDWPSVEARLALSQRFAPADENALRMRMDTWASLPVAARAEESLSVDVRIVLGHGGVELLRRLLASAPPWMLPAMREAAAGLSADRRGMIVQLLPALASATGAA